MPTLPIITTPNNTPYKEYGIVTKICGQNVKIDCNLCLKQVAGLQPILCAGDVCFSICYQNIVFANLPNNEVDFNTFILDSFLPISFILEKKIGSNWVQIAPITSLIAEIYPQGTFPQRPYYHGIALSWQAVFDNFGTGVYRVRASQTDLGCDNFYTFDFILYDFSCTKIDQTFKVTSYFQGFQGDRFDQTNEFYLGVEIADSSRYFGKMTNEKEIDFSKVNLYYADKKVVSQSRMHRNSRKVQYDLLFEKALPLELLARLANYGLNKAAITDYNIRNFRKYNRELVQLSDTYNFDENIKTSDNLVHNATIKVTNYNDNLQYSRKL